MPGLPLLRASLLLALGLPGSALQAAEPAAGASAEASSPPYVVDVLPAPFQRLREAPPQLKAFDFFSDGRAAACFSDGLLWEISGLEGAADHVRWRRAAEDCRGASDLSIIRDELYLLRKEGIEVRKTMAPASPAVWFAPFAETPDLSAPNAVLQRLGADATGNLYFNSNRKIAIDKNGSTHIWKVLANGAGLHGLVGGLPLLKALAVSASGDVAIAPGTQRPFTPGEIYLLRNETGTAGAAEAPALKQLCSLPDQSGATAALLEIPRDARWGGWGGSILRLTSEGKLSVVLFSAYQDPERPDCCNESLQGGEFLLPVNIRPASGPLRFNPVDGQLYLAGSDYMQRIRRSDAPPRLPIQWRATREGIELRFTATLDTQKACDPDNWKVEAQACLPAAKGFDREETPPLRKRAPWKVARATAGTDDRTVFLELPSISRNQRISMAYSIAAADGASMQGEFLVTVYGYAD